ncbi:cell surface protein [Methanosarcina sp. A14]|uniref:Cell surface protein n=1 Tax=Methanosarcina barkeri MS TaxID=1434108 RepID=A0A0E3QSJ8_METBA|nr:MULTISPECIES: NosD domain-containing protein [Methanosarcina]AKB53468.1 Cell surface protein [Methanosarcina barkeri MS]OEC94261.1 cell surface protein [Methanosarcina sp. A14]
MRRIKGHNFRAFKLTALAITLAVLCTCSASSASNLRVSSATDGDYISLQAAIDEAEAGDTIIVSPGTYVENLKINKQVQIWSESGNPEDTVIRAAEPTKSAVEISVDRASFSGFAIEGSEKAGILLTGVNSCYINNNRVQGAEYGILLKGSDSNTISNNLITLDEKGIRLENSNSNDIIGNTIAYNYGPGISLEASSKNLIYNNYFKNAENVDEKAANAENLWQSPLKTKKNIVSGPYIGGNFWADLEGKGYSETGVDENSNGICDTSYNITGGGTDNYPLFPKVPNAVKALESNLNASAYEQGLADMEKATSSETTVNKTEEATGPAAENATDENITNENATNENTTDKNATNEEGSGEKESPGPGPGIVGLAVGAAYFLRRDR